jgi:hypothetical protein
VWVGVIGPVGLGVRAFCACVLIDAGLCWSRWPSLASTASSDCVSLFAVVLMSGVVMSVVRSVVSNVVL